MKNILLIILFSTAVSCTAQIYPLRTYTEVPPNAYIKDLDNELLPYEGTWKGTWSGKIIYIYIKKDKSYFTHLENRPYYNDILRAKFKILNINGSILFDNTNLSFGNSKIVGNRFFSTPNNRYMLTYSDPDLCNTTGTIYISFTDPTKTTLEWKYNNHNEIITDDCPYYTTELPQPLPEEIVLTKQ